jgi:predicted flap endonuclease-1-like 5' DNA nuclease
MPIQELPCAEKNCESKMILTKRSDNHLYYNCSKNHDEHNFRYNAVNNKWEKVFTQTKIVLNYNKNPCEKHKKACNKSGKKSNHNKKTTKKSDLSEIKGIGSKRANELELIGVKTANDLASRSPKHLAEKMGLPIKLICNWIIEANKLI